MTIGDQLRIPIIRRAEDGTVTDGTALWEERENGGFSISDFRDLDGEPLPIPPGGSIEMAEL